MHEAIAKLLSLIEAANTLDKQQKKEPRVRAISVRTSGDWTVQVEMVNGAVMVLVVQAYWNE